MKVITFRDLLDTDWHRLDATHARYARDELVLAQGTPAQKIFVVRSGYVRVESGERGVAIAQCGPGEVLGEISFLENGTASANVYADSDAEIDIIEGDRIRALLESDPGFSARFYRSLAVSLAARLREASAGLGRLNVQDVSQVNHFHSTRTGHISERHVPEPLIVAMNGFRRQMGELEQTFRRGEPKPAHQAQVAAACNEVVSALERYTSEDALLEASLSDLMSFRDQEEIATGLGAYVFRQTFSFFMTSSTMAHCYTRPRGFSDDFKTGCLIVENDPDGDGVLGRFVDEWFLSGPLCRSRRLGHERALAVLSEVVSRREATAHVTDLACGGASTLLQFVSSTKKDVRSYCVDIDAEALAYVSEKADDMDIADRLRPHCLRGNVLALARRGGAISLQPQDLVHALNLFEYLRDEEVIAVLDWAYQALLPGGEFFATNVDVPKQYRLLMQHILEWEVIHRDAAKLEELVKRSRFAGGRFTIDRDALGITSHVRCAR